MKVTHGTTLGGVMLNLHAENEEDLRELYRLEANLDEESASRVFVKNRDDSKKYITDLSIIVM